MFAESVANDDRGRGVKNRSRTRRSPELSIVVPKRLDIASTRRTTPRVVVHPLGQRVTYHVHVRRASSLGQKACHSLPRQSAFRSTLTTPSSVHSAKIMWPQSRHVVDQLAQTLLNLVP
jgi:hypothetical protein